MLDPVEEFSAAAALERIDSLTDSLAAAAQAGEFERAGGLLAQRSTALAAIAAAPGADVAALRGAADKTARLLDSLAVNRNSLRDQLQRLHRDGVALRAYLAP